MKMRNLFKVRKIRILIYTLLTLPILGLAFLKANSLVQTVNADSGKDGYTLVYEKENYEYEKLEQEEGALLGAYVLQDDYIEQSMETFNEVTEKQHASFFKYVGYGKEFPTEWVAEVVAQGGIPHIAFEPNDGLEVVNDDEYLREWAKAANASSTPIFIRWASEMNGTWTQYSGKSDLYKEKWQLVYNVFQEEAPNCAFVWTVFTFPESTIEQFYPGDEYVDWVGVNIYSVVYHNNDINDEAFNEDPLELLDYVYNTYSYKKPIQISEFGATHYSATDEQTYSGWAAEKIRRLYSNIETYYPRVKSIFYFDVNNLNTYNADRRVNDYSITDDEIVLNTYNEVVSDDWFLSSYEENSLTTGTETLTYNGFTTVIDKRTYAPVEYFENYLGLEVVDLGNGKYELTRGETTVTVESANYTQTTNFDVVREFTVLPVTESLKDLGYTILTDKNKMRLIIQD